jgi:GNAT superfamily N-acetyltransferase
VRIERFQASQAGAVSCIIRRNLIEINSRDYAQDRIDALVAYFSPEKLVENSRSQRIFVAIQDDRVVGTASLDNFGSAESADYYAVAVFVLPELHGQGIGTRLMQAVESEARRLGAERITVRAAITARDFYLKLGYGFRNGVEVLDENRNYLMEKACVPCSLLERHTTI